MTTIYLIRHSIKDKNFGEMDNSDSMQLQDEKEFLSPEGEKKHYFYHKIMNYKILMKYGLVTM